MPEFRGRLTIRLGTTTTVSTEWDTTALYPASGTDTDMCAADEVEKALWEGVDEYACSRTCVTVTADLSSEHFTFTNSGV